RGPVRGSGTGVASRPGRWAAARPRRRSTRTDPRPWPRPARDWRRPRRRRWRSTSGALDTSSDDRLTLLSGTGQNVVGLVVYVLASFAVNVLIFRGFGAGGAAALGLVTLATQLAFVAGAGTRFGMDMAAVRRVAIEVGGGEAGR